MEFSVKRSDLLDELELTQGVVERKTTIPILSNLLLEAKGSRLTITATDLELSIRTSCDAKVKKEGAGTIPAKKLFELLRLLPEGEVKFKLLENHWVHIISDRRNYKLVGMSKDNFPALPAFPHALVKIPAKLLADAMVETDHKFEGFSNETRVLIPKKAMTEVQRLVGKSGDDVQIEFGQDESHLFFQVGRRLLTSRKLTGQFPNYEAVLPRDANKTLSLERVELQDALRRVAQLADQRSHAVKFTLTTEGLEVSSSSPEYGEAKEIIEKEFKGETIAIGFNAQYLLDFLAAAADGPISFELKDEQSAGQLRPTGDETSRYRYVVMPMRI
jgi:DNA polymerase-3 subunit beta